MDQVTEFYSFFGSGIFGSGLFADSLFRLLSVVTQQVAVACEMGFPPPRE